MTKPTKFATYLLRIEPKKLKALQRVAEADHRTVASELRRLIDERLEKDKAA